MSYATSVPPNTFYRNQDIGGTIVDLEPLSTAMHFHYYSISKNRECEIKLDKLKKEFIPDAGNIPQEFDHIIKGIYKEVTGGDYNKYEKAWGTSTYNKIVNFLTVAKDILPEEDLEEEISSYFNFNPNSVLSLKGNLNDENNEYYAKCDSIVLVDKIIINIEKELYLLFDKNDKITAEHYYYYEGEEIYSHSIRNIPNDDGYQLYSILKNYQDKVEESLLETIVLRN